MTFLNDDMMDDGFASIWRDLDDDDDDDDDHHHHEEAGGWDWDDDDAPPAPAPSSPSSTGRRRRTLVVAAAAACAIAAIVLLAVAVPLVLLNRPGAGATAAVGGGEASGADTPSTTATGTDGTGDGGDAAPTPTVAYDQGAEATPMNDTTATTTTTTTTSNETTAENGGGGGGGGEGSPPSEEDIDTDTGGGGGGTHRNESHPGDVDDDGGGPTLEETATSILEWVGGERPPVSKEEDNDTTGGAGGGGSAYRNETDGKVDGTLEETASPPPTPPAPQAQPEAVGTETGVISETEEEPTYRPGSLTVYQDDIGLRLSAGLTARVIARSGSRVRLSNGERSTAKFHYKPDGAAVFVHPDGEDEGWAYVSNSEVSYDWDGMYGGVGMIRFDATGNVVEYRMILKGTELNCSGGKTPWKTWLSAEENEPIGQIYEVDPFGRRPPRRTVLGEGGGNFESVTVDNRDPYRPKFFITNDSEYGEVRRFTPDPNVVRRAMNGEGDYWDILGTEGTMEYLVLIPEDEYKDGGWSTRRGTFRWSSTLGTGRESASWYFPKSEGIDFRKGYVYVALKEERTILVLNLDERTYEKFSTESGSFLGEPDAIKFLPRTGVDGDGDDDDGGILYFTEDSENRRHSDAGPAGVHAVDADGGMYKVMEETGDESKEMTGLAFSPDNTRMYVGVWTPGVIYELKREDGMPFGGETLDIRHHKSVASSNLFQR